MIYGVQCTKLHFQQHLCATVVLQAGLHKGNWGGAAEYTSLVLIEFQKAIIIYGASVMFATVQ